MAKIEGYAKLPAALGPDHGSAVSEGRRHRLLTDHILAPGKGPERHLLVKIIWHGNDHGCKARTLQELVHIGEPPAPGLAKICRGILQPRRVGVAEGNHVRGTADFL